MPTHQQLSKVGMMVVLVGVALYFAWRLVARSHDPTSRLNLDDLLVDDATDRISKAAAVMMGSFFVTSWVVVYETLIDKITDTLFAAYVGAWVIPSVTKLITNRPQSPQPIPPRSP